MSNVPGVPRFPNIGSTFGSTVPVVTTLLAGLSSGASLVPLSQDFNSVNLALFGFRFGSSRAAIVLGLASSASFVAATMFSVYAHAHDFDALSEDRQRAFLSKYGLQGEKAKTAQDKYAQESLRFYEFVRLLTLMGVALLSLTLGFLTIAEVPLLGPVVSMTAFLVAALIALDFESWRRLVGVMMLLICSAAFVTTL